MADPRLTTIQARLAAGDAAAAHALATELLAAAGTATSDRFAALMLRSRAHEALHKLDEAIVDVEGALALVPDDARAHNELGILCADAGQPSRAIAAFTKATRLDPRYARAWNNLGNALRDDGRVDEAEAAFVRATDADARYALAWTNLGVVRRDLGRDDAAITAFERALALDPRQRLALTALAGVRRAQGAVDEAASLYERALAADPRDATSWLLYGGTLAERDDLDGAVRAYAEAEARNPKLLRAWFGRHLTLPMVARGAADAKAARAKFMQGLDDLERELPARVAGMTADAVIDEIRWTNFLLAYQGEDDREAQARFGRLLGNAIEHVQPSWREPMPRRHRAGRRLRVGFVSAFFREGTVGRYFERWVTDLPRDAFEVVVYHQQPARDEIAQRLAARADRFRHCPRLRPSQVAARVREDAPDVLVYPELGMDGTTFAVASLRLAPLQCAAWGHPVTTGLDTIDVFFSCEAMEPAGAADHYTERLVALPGIGTRYAAPVLPQAATREALGLPDHEPLLLCPQSLFKIAPDDDALFARVLAAVPRARLVLFEGRHPALTSRYLDRLAAAGVSRDRLIVRPQCRHDIYLQINLACTAMLDTLRWSGGNTSLDAIACGLPIVTLPGRFMRARQSAAMLALAGVDELIAKDAADYRRIVTRIVSEPEWRDTLAARLRAGQSRVFDDAKPVRALADWLIANG